MIRHAVYRVGFTTLCEKDAGRVKWTKMRALVTCRACRKALDQLRAMLPPGLYRLDRFADDEPAIVEVWL